MKVERIICPACESEKRVTSEEDNTHEYSEEIISRTCEKTECQDSPENKLLQAIFGVKNE